jgi:hypothetical protein
MNRGLIRSPRTNAVKDTIAIRAKNEAYILKAAGRARLTSVPELVITYPERTARTQTVAVNADKPAIKGRHIANSKASRDVGPLTSSAITATTATPPATKERRTAIRR